MYPANFFSLFPAFPRNQRIFVAMSFDSRFDMRWNNVLDPAVRDIQIDGLALEPHRVDLTMSGDSILTEILDQISQCQIFLADITALDVLNGKSMRNPNVFYEIGLAHSVRLPEEVILFRSDKYELAFDISNVRVHLYDPDNYPDKARKLVSSVIKSSLHELDLRKHLAIRQAASKLDYESLIVLAEAQQGGGVTPPLRQTAGQILTAIARMDAISRLLELNALQTEFSRAITEVSIHQTAVHRDSSGLGVSYKITPFGSALLKSIKEGTASS